MSAFSGCFLFLCKKCKRILFLTKIILFLQTTYTNLHKRHFMHQNRSQEIEQLSIEIMQQEKIYALALKLRTNKDTLQEMLSTLTRLKTELQKLQGIPKE